ncbi:DUF6434 domain-containing protein [Georgenia sp. H159]|uniref:DUF6434 domain-containing protein n=1 Tax=Georgenia sp. H159 TaxID=3076115 RepID=UPI002D795929|nr:DUF6434 domain-containing protein [Georgenia sp. H159]
MDTGTRETRPPIATVRTGVELRRWYWLRTELAELAGVLGLPRGGSKEQLLERVAAVLDGAPPPAQAPRRAVGAQLEEPVGPGTVIPPGQRCGQVLRRFFTAQIGPHFRFDEHMREFVAHGTGRTFGEAVQHWYRTRDAPAGPIGQQFEYNRFTRAWFTEHPGGSQAECRAAWQRHRARPVDQRPPVRGGGGAQGAR